MHRHIEPALKAWQAAWASNPHHSLERPNPYGFGTTISRQYSLLDLAYVRLFVNLSRSKEKFWQGLGWDGEELSLVVKSFSMLSIPRIQFGIYRPSDNSASSSVFVDSPPTSTSSQSLKLPGYQRTPPNISIGFHFETRTPPPKAAFYAADHSQCQQLGVTLQTHISRTSTTVSHVCIDCAQVLAEWIATVQERVGRYLGILGKDDIDVSQVLYHAS